MVTTAEVRAVGPVVGDATAAVVDGVEQVHRSVAARVLGHLGVFGRPVRVVHDGISRGVYATVRGAAATVPRAASAGAAALAAVDGSRGVIRSRALERPSVAVPMGAVTGLWGDRIATTYPALDDEMAVRVDGRAVATDPSGLAAAFPDATADVVVFLHGLCETELAWAARASGDADSPRVPPPDPSPVRRGGGSPRPSFGDRLAEDLGSTPVLVRYNSGLRVGANGRRLSRLLDELVAGWPV